MFSRRSILAGVPQCVPLGPVLFNTCTNDIQSVQNDKKVTLSLHADNTNVTVRSGSIELREEEAGSGIRMLQLRLGKWRI